MANEESIKQKHAKFMEKKNGLKVRSFKITAIRCVYLKVDKRCVHVHVVLFVKIKSLSTLKHQPC